MILFDTLYIHNSGGKIILDLIIEFITKNKLQKNFFFLVDSRYSNTRISEFQHVVLRNKENLRKQFYIKNHFKFSTICCLANVPLPINTKTPTLIYFHNDLLLDLKETHFSFIKKIIFYLKRIYIYTKINKDYIWAVQTNLMKAKLTDKFNIKNDQINVYPIFKEESISAENLKNKNTFLYVSNFNSHKNFKNLITALLYVAERTYKIITLELTINQEAFLKNLIKISPPENLKINFHGILNKKELNKLYERSEYLIYPSLKESFGLPLVEAVQFNCKVIASDLPYVHEIIEPSLTFNPYSHKDISKIINLALESKNLKKSKIKIKNKLPEMIDYLINKNKEKN